MLAENLRVTAFATFSDRSTLLVHCVLVLDGDRSVLLSTATEKMEVDEPRVSPNISVTNDAPVLPPKPKPGTCHFFITYSWMGLCQTIIMPMRSFYDCSERNVHRTISVRS